jgi:hypothetical protein
MSEHGKLVNILLKLHLIEEGQRSISEIKEQIKYYERRNSEILEHQSNLNLNGKMPDYVDTEIKITNTKIKMLKWAIYKWLEWDCKEVEEISDKCNVSNIRSVDSAFATHRDIGAYLHRKNGSIDKIIS